MAITPTLKLGSAARQLINTQTLAAAGSAQTDGALITTKSPAIVYATGANGTKGIMLPKAVPGKVYTIKNRDSDNGVLKVYAYETGGQINAITAGSPISLAAKVCCDFICVTGGSSSLWVTKPLLPS